MMRRNRRASPSTSIRPRPPAEPRRSSRRRGAIAALALAALLGVRTAGAVGTPADPTTAPRNPGAAPTDLSAPILRIETGMHGAVINRLAVVDGGRAVVTVSDDKTT